VYSKLAGKGDNEVNWSMELGDRVRIASLSYCNGDNGIVYSHTCISNKVAYLIRFCDNQGVEYYLLENSSYKQLTRQQYVEGIKQGAEWTDANCIGTWHNIVLSAGFASCSLIYYFDSIIVRCQNGAGDGLKIAVYARQKPEFSMITGGLVGTKLSFDGAKKRLKETGKLSLPHC
jgi:hypothetical protein